MKRLTNFQPELTKEGKKKSGRPKGASRKDITLLSTSIADLCSLNRRILARLEGVEEENRKLQDQINNNAHQSPSYSDIVKNSVSNSAQGGNSDHQSHTNFSSIDGRLDRVEQDSLENFVKIDGKAPLELVSKISERSSRGCLLYTSDAADE